MLPDLTALEDAPLIKLGNISLTLGGVITGAVMIGAALALAWVVTRGIRRLRVRAHRATGALYLLEKLAGYGIVVSGVMFGLSAAGLNLSSLAVFAGAIGIGIGLGLQGVVKEFVSGLFIIFDGMVSVGDYVELEGVRGVIAEIGPRATRIRNNDNIDVVVPNSKLIEGTVTNWTLKGDTRRIHIPFGVAYESDRAAVREAVLAAARASPFTLPETETRKKSGLADRFRRFQPQFRTAGLADPGRGQAPGSHARRLYLGHRRRAGRRGHRDPLPPDRPARAQPVRPVRRRRAGGDGTETPARRPTPACSVRPFGQ